MDTWLLVGSGDSGHGFDKSTEVRSHDRGNLVVLVALAFILLGVAQKICAQGTWSIIGRLETRRYVHTTTLLADGRILVVGGTRNMEGSASVEIFDPMSGTWANAVDSLNEARWGHTATLLPDGRVLVAGGDNGPETLDSFEIFDPATGTWSMTSETLNYARASHTATLLANGQVLVAGGYGPDPAAIESFEIFDPIAGTWSSTMETLNYARKFHTATLLLDGQVLVAGGQGTGGFVSVLEVFNPATRTWSTVSAPLNDARSDHTATLLPDGPVLVAGGYGTAGFLATSEVFDPATNSLSVTSGTLTIARMSHTSTLLSDGRILITGGVDSFNSNSELDSCEIFDPTAGTWAMLPESLAEARSYHTATLLPEGRVLVIGGIAFENELNSIEAYSETGTWSMPPSTLVTDSWYRTTTLLPDGRVLTVSGTTAEIFDSATDAWVVLPAALHVDRTSYFTATLLSDGRVLVTGGSGTDSCEVFDPETGIWSMPSSTLSGIRSRHSATLLSDGRVLVAGGLSSHENYLDTVEIFDPDTDTWSMTTHTLNQARMDHTATLLYDGRVLITGGSFDRTPLDSCEVYDPATGVWTMHAENLNGPRSSHTATLLFDGRVLVAGGTDGGTLETYELFDPESGVWTMPLTPINNARLRHTATLLPDGRVLVAGGRTSIFDLDTFEIFEPQGGTWTLPSETLNQARGEHTATLLPDGRVLVVGDNDPGILDTFELHTPMELPASRRPNVTISPQIAGYWLPPGAPGCMNPYVPSSECDSGTLLVGRDTITNGAELNQPNTIDGCPDGTTGTYHVDESIDRVRIYSSDGSRLSAGKPATVEVTLWAFSGQGSDILEIYSADDALAPDWIPVDTIEAQPGQQSLTTTFTLPQGGVQAVRTRLHYNEPSGACNTAADYDDHDDLIFGVVPGSERYTNPITPGEPYTVWGTGFGGDSEAADGTTGSSAVNYPVTTLRSVESDRLFTLTPDPRSNFSDDPMTLTFSELPPDLDVGMHYLTVAASGVPSVSRLVEVHCGAVTSSSPENETVNAGLTATFTVTAENARSFQWLRCTAQECDDGDWEAIVGATSASYTTPPTDPADSGTRYSVEVRGSCDLNSAPCDEASDYCLRTDAATLTVRDLVHPTAHVLYPNGGEYWLLSDPGDDGLPGTADDPPPNTQLITWSMTDDVRLCQVDVSLWSSEDGGEVYTCVNGCVADGSGLPITFGDGGSCVHPGVSTASTEYTVPTSPPSGVPGSLYKVKVTVTDCETADGARSATAWSPNPFYIVEPNPEAVDTIVLANPSRMATVLGATVTQTTNLTTKLYELADHPRVQGLVVDLGGVTALGGPYAAFDSAIVAAQASPGDSGLLGAAAAAANDLVVAIHDHVLTLLDLYTGVEHIVLVGDDRIIPFARIGDDAALLTESTYPAGPDLSPGETTVGQALAADLYLSDDPMATAAPFTPPDLDTDLFVPDLAVGRLVETHGEITNTIATFISSDGVLDMDALDYTTGHKVLVTGYDFLIDSARKVRSRWKARLGDTGGDASLEPVDGSLISETWSLSDATTRSFELFDHLAGNGGDPYAVMNLNGHATHYQEGVPGTNPHDIEGLDAVHLYGADGCSASDGPLDFPGALVYSVGCHSGLPVPGSCSTDSEHSLDLAQTMLSRGALAYLGNTGYGWGLVSGIGYSERVVEIFTEDLTAGGTRSVGELIRRTKLRYVLESPRFDAYDAKSLMQWTLFGLPMVAVKTGIATTEASPFTTPAPEIWEVERELCVGDVRVNQTVNAEDRRALPSYLTRLEMHWDLTAEGIYQKRTASGEALTEAVTGCPDPEGCYYTLNGLVERGSGSTDLPIQPYFIFDSRLSGTSQHGVLWMGGTYDQESDWIPVIAELASNGGDGSDHGSIARTAINRPTGTRILGGADPDACRTSDLELNGLVVTTGEAVKLSSVDPSFTIERLYRSFDLEVLYYNNSYDGSGNCDRDGPLFDPGPYSGEYHEFSDGVVTWAVPVTDTGGIWRVVVVATDNTVDGSSIGRWLPIDLTDDGTGTWRATMNVSGIDTLTYVIQAVDTRGNVSWLEYETTRLPASGVDPGIPLPVDVIDPLIFADGFESGDISRWTGAVQ